jgi:hypothetical protein
MAIALTEKLGAGNFASTSNVASYATGSITWTANRLALLFIYNSDGSNAIAPASVTGNSLTWSLHTTAQHATDATRRLSLYYAWTGTGASAGAVTVGFGADNQTGCTVHAIEVSGSNASATSNGLGGIVQLVQGSWSATSNPSITTLAAFADPTNNMTVGSIHTGNTDPSVGSGFTSIQETTYLTPNTFLITEYKAGEDLVVDVVAGSHTGTGFALELAVASAGITVTPTTTALVLATFAGTVTASNHQLVTPTTTALVATRFAPQANLRINAAAPTALVLSPLAPTVTATNHQSVTPTTAALVTTKFAPVIGLRINAASPTALVLSTFAPVVTASNHQLVTPTTASLTLATFAPTVTAGAGLTLVPTTATLVTATFAPTVTATANQVVTPTTATLTTTRFIPVLNETVTPGRVPGPGFSLNLSFFSPTVAVSNNQTVTPTTATLATATFAATIAHRINAAAPTALTLTAFAPTVSATAHQTLTPTTATLTLTAFVPLVTGGAGLTVIPTTAALALTTFAPSVAVTNHQTVTPTTKALLTATFAATVSVTAHQLVTPGFATLATNTFAPVLGLKVIAGNASLTLATFAPTPTVNPALMVIATNSAFIREIQGTGSRVLAAVGPGTSRGSANGKGSTIRDADPTSNSGSAGGRDSSNIKEVK